MKYKINSMVCKYDHMASEWFNKWRDALKIPFNYSPINRKHWEWCAISQALYERGFLQAGKRGIGFAVGQEPLPSLFASLGVDIVATDLGNDVDGWSKNNQHASSLTDLFKESIVSRDVFHKHVKFNHADMNHIPDSYDNEFDFVWSSCAFEHLGNLQNGIDFVYNSMDLLKPGGVAVHTTEYNVSSNLDTLSEGISVIYRKQDLEQLSMKLRRKRIVVEEFDFSVGDKTEDLDFDEEPFGNKPYHIKLLIGDYVSTSFILIAQKLF